MNNLTNQHPSLPGPGSAHDATREKQIPSGQAFRQTRVSKGNAAGL